jgi:hypothetical protein
LILKTTYKSHFNFKKCLNKKNQKKQIFTKNIILFILFGKIFFQNHLLGIKFSKNKQTLNILKAPSRHKKFFHQIYIEYFNTTLTWHINDTTNIISLQNSILLFKKINKIFLKIGTNTLTRTKLSFCNPVDFKNITDI